MNLVANSGITCQLTNPQGPDTLTFTLTGEDCVLAGLPQGFNFQFFDTNPIGVPGHGPVSTVLSQTGFPGPTALALRLQDDADTQEVQYSYIIFPPSSS